MLNAELVRPLHANRNGRDHFPRSERGGVQVWLECQGIGGGGNSRFAGPDPSYPRLAGYADPAPNEAPVSCLFLWSWDIAQPSPPPQPIWVVDSYNAMTAAVGIKLIVML